MNHPSQVLLELDDVTVQFGSKCVIDRLTWSLHDGDCAVILGPSGRGKSVFLNTLLGFIPPTAGHVRHPVSSDLFETTAVLFQNDALLEDRTIEANLALAREADIDLLNSPFALETDRAIDAALREVELEPAIVRKQFPNQLSGGMRRRVGLARALLRRPRILIADEPTSGLDPASALVIYELLARLISEHRMSAIIVTHDPYCASRLGLPVYYFSPVGGAMPRWEPPSAAEPGERQSALLGWMNQQIAEHQAREKMSIGESVFQAGDSSIDPDDRMWRRVSDPVVTRAGHVGLLLGQLTFPGSPALLTRNLLNHGIRSIPLLALIFFMLGVVMQVQAELAVVDYGLSNRLPELVALSLLRLAPILTGFLLAGRCGSAIAAQFGAMQLGGQLRALVTFRIDPDRRMFPPLFWSLLVAAPVLALLGIAIGAGGALFALASPLSSARITSGYFLSAFPGFLNASELLLVILKGLLIGAGLAVIAYVQAVKPKRSPADVTDAITRTLVLNFIWCGLVDTVISLLLSF